MNPILRAEITESRSSSLFMSQPQAKHRTGIMSTAGQQCEGGFPQAAHQKKLCVAEDVC